MQRQRGELVPLAEALSELPGPVQALREATPQSLHHFTQADQVNQLVSASEADPDLGFMARMLALCSLPRTNPGNQYQYKRVNGPYKLILSRTGEYKLPFGNLPRLLLAWVSTEAVRTQSREIVLGKSLSGFMRKLGMEDRSGREDQAGLAGVELLHASGGLDALALDTGHRAAESRPTRSLISPFRPLSGPSAALLRLVGPLDPPQPRSA